MIAHLDKLSSFHTRYYNSVWGRETSEYLMYVLDGYLAKGANTIEGESSKRLVIIKPVSHGFKQFSIVSLPLRG